MKILGKEIKFPTFKSYNTLIGSTLKSGNAAIVAPQRQLTGEYPPVSPTQLFQYYYGWDQVKAAIDVKHQKFWGRGIEIKSKNEAFNKFVKKWLDLSNGEKKISEAVYSLLITGDFFIEKQFTPDGRLANVEHVPMTTIFRMYRDQYANELKLVQLVDGIYKELDPANYVHGMINNPSREAFGHSEFHTLAAPRPIAGEIDPITNQPINPSRNLRSLLDAQAILQNAEIEIKLKMAKPRILASVNGMPPAQMLAVQKEMADPANDQWIWLFDRPVDSKELAVSAQTKFDTYGDNVDAHIDIGTGFASNVIKNPSGFSYSSSQTPLDVLDQRMMDIQSDVGELLTDELFKPLAESWGFKDVEFMEIEITFLPTIKRLQLDEINTLDKNAVCPKEFRKLYKDHQINLDDKLFEEWQNEQKQQKQEIAKQNLMGMQGEDDKKSPRPPKNPDSPLTKDKPLFQNETPKPPRTDTREVFDGLKELLKEVVVEVIKERGAERYELSPLQGKKDVHSDLIGSQTSDKPEITDPKVLDAYGLNEEEQENREYDREERDQIPTQKQPSTNDLAPMDNTRDRFTNRDNIGIKQVSQDDYNQEENTKSPEESDPNMPHREFEDNEKGRIDVTTLDDKKPFNKKTKEAFQRKEGIPLDLKNDVDGSGHGNAVQPLKADGFKQDEMPQRKQFPKKDERQTNPDQVPGDNEQVKTVSQDEFMKEEQNKQPVQNNTQIQSTNQPDSQLEQKDQLVQDPETGRNYTNTTDELGNKDPDLRFDQTPDSEEDQPEIERVQPTVTQQQFNQQTMTQKTVPMDAYKQEHDGMINRASQKKQSKPFPPKKPKATEKKKKSKESYTKEKKAKTDKKRKVKK